MDQIISASAGDTYGMMLKTSFAFISALNLYTYHDPRDACASNNSEYDYIVVGAGTSGCVVASRLSENEHIRVLLLEAGGNTQMENVIPRLRRLTLQSRVDWNYTAEPDENYKKCHLDSRCPRSTGKVFGGLSAVDMTIYSRGCVRDFDALAKLTNDSSWSYSNVLRLYIKLENFDDKNLKNSPDGTYHGFDGIVGLTKETSPVLDMYYEAYSQLGQKRVQDINNRTRQGVTDAVYYIKDNARQSSAWTYLNRAKSRKNLDVMKNILVTKILFDGKRAVGVEALDQNNNTLVFRANKEVIVSAGTFNSPKLLQTSGIGPKNLLKSLGIEVISDLPVGENYQTHTSTVLMIATRKTNCTFVPENNNLGNYPLPAIISHSEVSDCDPHYKVYRTINSIVPVTPATTMLIYGPALTRFKYSILDNWYNKSKGRELMMIMIENVKVASRGTVHINSTDPFDPPTINANFYSNKTDVDNMIKYLKDSRSIINTPVFKKNGAFFIDPDACSGFKPESDEFYECFVRCMMVPLSHDCGTTALGSVVDGDMLVKGVKALRVVGASIFPETISGGVTGPSMMLGELAAEKIIQDYNKYIIQNKLILEAAANFYKEVSSKKKIYPSGPLVDKVLDLFRVILGVRF